MTSLWSSVPHDGGCIKLMQGPGNRLTVMSASDGAPDKVVGTMCPHEFLDMALAVATAHRAMVRAMDVPK